MIPHVGKQATARPAAAHTLRNVWKGQMSVPGQTDADSELTLPRVARVDNVQSALVSKYTGVSVAS